MNSCRDGHLRCTGAATANRCGAIRHTSPTKRWTTPQRLHRRARSSRASRGGSTFRCRRRSPRTRTPGISLRRNGDLPENLDPIDNKLDDPMARERLASVFERGLGTPVGFVLPVQRWQAAHDRRRWMTEAWSTRSKRLFVLPGESPVGYRLPLPSLPHLSPAHYPHHHSARPLRAPGEARRARPASAAVPARWLDARARSRAGPNQSQPNGTSKGWCRCALRSSSSRATVA